MHGYFIHDYEILIQIWSTILLSNYSICLSHLILSITWEMGYGFNYLYGWGSWCLKEYEIHSRSQLIRTRVRLEPIWLAPKFFVTNSKIWLRRKKGFEEQIFTKRTILILRNLKFWQVNECKECGQSLILFLQRGSAAVASVLAQTTWPDFQRI